MGHLTSGLEIVSNHLLFRNVGVPRAAKFQHCSYSSVEIISGEAQQRSSWHISALLVGVVLVETLLMTWSW